MHQELEEIVRVITVLNHSPKSEVLDRITLGETTFTQELCESYGFEIERYSGKGSAGYELNTLPNDQTKNGIVPTDLIKILTSLKHPPVETVLKQDYQCCQSAQLPLEITVENYGYEIVRADNSKCNTNLLPIPKEDRQKRNVGTVGLYFGGIGTLVLLNYLARTEHFAIDVGYRAGILAATSLTCFLGAIIVTAYFGIGIKRESIMHALYNIAFDADKSIDYYRVYQLITNSEKDLETVKK